MTSVRPYKATEMATAKPVTWRLAPGYLAAGKVSLLVGDEGIGKSLWTIRAIEAITTGEPWGPFTIASDPANVVLIATEDGWEDTIRPRLDVTKADLLQAGGPLRKSGWHRASDIPDRHVGAAPA